LTVAKPLTAAALAVAGIAVLWKVAGKIAKKSDKN
jgi:hypothetical protein